MHDPLRVRVRGPLAPYAAGYAAELSRLGYMPSGATLQVRLLADLSAWLEHEGIEPGSLAPAQVDRFLVARRAAGHTRYASAKATRPPLEYLRGLGVVPVAPEVEPDGPVDRLLTRSRRYLVVERSLGSARLRGTSPRSDRFSRAGPRPMGSPSKT